MTDEHDSAAPPFWLEDPFAAEDDGPTVTEVATKAMNEEVARRQAAAAAEALTGAAGAVDQAAESAGQVVGEAVGHLTDVFPEEEPDDRSPFAKKVDEVFDDHRAHHQMQLPDDPPPRVRPGGRTHVRDDATVAEHGIEAPAPSVEDTPEIAALAERAAQLRANYVETQFGEGRTDRGEHRSDVEREQKLAETGLQMSTEEATRRQQSADERAARAADLDQQASAAEARGDASHAQELREDAARTQAAAQSDVTLAQHARDEVAKYQQQIDATTAELSKIGDAAGTRFEFVGKGEEALDQLEHKVELMRAAHAQATLVTDLERREGEARAAGDTAQADQLATQLQTARTTAAGLQQAAEAAAVDEPTLQQLQTLDPVAPAPTPDGDTTPDGSATTPTPASSGATDVPAVPDPPEIAQLAERAAHLREQALAAIRQEMDDREQEYTDVKKEQLQAASMVEYSQLRAQTSREELQEVQARANEDELRAVEAEAKGDTRAAEELREHAARILVVGRAREGQSAKLDAEHEQYKAQAAQLQQRLDTLKAASEARIEKLNNAEDAIDAIEDRVRSLREIQTQTAIAEDLDRQAAATRAGGNAAEAQELADEAAAHRTAAAAAQTRLDATPVDESSLQVLEDVDVTTQPPLGSPPAAPTEPPAAGDSDTSSDPTSTDESATMSDPIGDLDPAPAATTEPASGDGATTSIDDPVAPVADTSAPVDAVPDVSSPADAATGVIADASFDGGDAALGMQDFTAPVEQAPGDDTSMGDEL